MRGLGPRLVAAISLFGLCFVGPAFIENRPSTLQLRERALKQWNRLPRFTPNVVRANGSISGTVWKPIGPSPITENGCCVPVTFSANGRVNSLAVDPTNPDRIYLGSAGGGVWRSDDAGKTWVPLTDQEISLGIGSSHALAIDPNHPNVIYAGTSNFGLLAQSQPRLIDASQSKGILKSTDGGASWIVLGSGTPSGNDGNAYSTFNGEDVTTILVDPLDSTRLYAATGRTAAGGLYRSVDAGLNWTPGTGGNGLAESLVLDPSSPFDARVLYAGLNGSGVRKSIDGGHTWTQVLDSTTPVVAAALPNGFSKVMVSLAPTASPPNPQGQVVYATMIAREKSGRGVIFESTDGGGSWVKKNGQVVFSDPDFAILAGSAFSDMVVDPASPGDGVHDLIYWGGFSQFFSTDSGDTFVEVGQVHGTHGDHQVFLLIPRPGDTSIVYAGDDGGLWRSMDQGASWTGTSLSGLSTTLNKGGLQIATLYALALKPDTTASVTLGGAQDSGILRTAGTLEWTGTSDDGIDLVFDKLAPGVAYVIENDRIRKSNDDGATWPIDLTANIPLPGEISIFLNRLAVDPSRAGYLYVGGSAGSVFQSTNAGSSFRSLGQPAPNKYVSSLDVAPGDSNRLVISADTKVFVTTNALAATVGPPSGVEFQSITRNLPARFVTRVAFDPNDANVVYATLAGYDATTPGHPGHVFRTTLDPVAPWTDISPAVDIPVNALALDGAVSPTDIYTGTDLGVLRGKPVGGATWVVVDDIHLPNAAVSDLELNATAGVLRAATWGRGVFELTTPTGPVIALNAASLEFGDACALTGAARTLDVSNVGTQNLVLTSVARLAGSTDFTVLASPPMPVTLGPGEHASFTVGFVPTSAGPVSAIIRVTSNDPGAHYVDLPATGRREIEPPHIFCPAPIVIECTGPSGAVASFSATAIDNCSVASVSCPASGSTFPLGTTPVSCSATDTAANGSSCSSSVKVVDTTPPNITALNAAPALLWPPNHAFVPVSLSVNVTDICDPSAAQTCHVVSVTSNEPVLGGGTGNTTPDWEITGNLSVKLRAERAGSGNGRIYTIVVQCSDASGNAATRSTTVIVPHNR